VLTGAQTDGAGPRQLLETSRLSRHPGNGDCADRGCFPGVRAERWRQRRRGALRWHCPHEAPGTMWLAGSPPGSSTG
jgi:hypothetical protein